jgi:hypothetical protein
MWPSLTRMTGCHAGDRPSSQPSRTSEPPPLRSRRGAGPSDRDLDLLRLNGQGHSSIGPYFQAGRNRFANILDRLTAGLALQHAAGNARAFRDPHAVFVMRQRDEEFHAWILSHLESGGRKRALEPPVACRIRLTRARRWSFGEIPRKNAEIRLPVWVLGLIQQRPRRPRMRVARPFCLRRPRLCPAVADWLGNIKPETWMVGVHR